MPKYLFSDKHAFKKVRFPRKKGLSWWRHICTGVRANDGRYTSFFIEYAAVNLSISPQAVIRNNKLEEDNAPRTKRAKKAALKTAEKPSYILVRAGFFDSREMVFEEFFPASELRYKREDSALVFKECSLADSTISGSITQHSVIYSLFSDKSHKDTLAWNLSFKEDTVLNARIAYNAFKWLCSGSKTFVTGSTRINDDVYTIADTSFCYLDKAYGKEIPEYWFHVSGVHMVSRITNKKLEASCVIAQSFTPGKITIFLALESIHLSFKPRKMFKNMQSTACIKNEDKIHWTTSAQSGKYVLDIDIFCPAPEMKVRNYDSPNGQGLFLSLLTGASGSGEIKLFKRIKKSLELIEHADIKNAHCEFGGKDVLTI
ncbi:MAG: hypothetical protein Pg6C_14730 [Treponemataceae bacterium]|nr:MAG: hypothetical protein Pg6C_14730 [Treponemataceae bacterium]